MFKLQLPTHRRPLGAPYLATNRAAPPRSQSSEAKRSILLFLGESGWREQEWIIFNGEHVLRRRERFKLVLHLKANGCDDEWIKAAVFPRLRDGDARKVHKRWKHVDSILSDIDSGKYDHKWVYHSLRDNDFKYLSGDVCTSRPAPQPLARLMNAWDAEIQRVVRTEGRYPTMPEQDCFFASPPPSPPSSPTPDEGGVAAGIDPIAPAGGEKEGVDKEGGDKVDEHPFPLHVVQKLGLGRP